MVSEDARHALRNRGTLGFDKSNPRAASDSYDQWAREVGKLPLLTRQEEIELAKRMEQNDQEARDRFIESNFKLVISIARRYRGYGVPMEDIIQEGNLGLIKAVDHFDYRKGCRFSTCGATWIEGQIRRSIDRLRHTIQLPWHSIGSRRKMNRVSEELNHKLGRTPTAEEIADTMGVEAEHVTQLLSLPPDPISLEEILEKDTSRFSDELLEDQSTTAPEDYLHTENVRRQLSKAIARLKPKHQTVLKLRYGLEGEREHTLEEVGQKMQLTRQRVWQIESTALRNMKRVYSTDS